MARPKTVTLKGAAARAYFLASSGVPPQTEEDALQSIATRIHMELHADNLTGAVEILQHLLKHGALKTGESLTVDAGSGLARKQG